MTTLIRLAPSGPVIPNAGGAPLGFGPGARLRLTEASSPMTGSLAIPTVPDTIDADGFGTGNAIVLTLTAPKQGLNYRAMVALDISNTNTNVEGEVTLWLDTSIDGGATYVNHAKNDHVIAPLHPALAGSTARQATLWMPMINGVTLGISDATPPASIKLRARASAPAGNPLVFVSSPVVANGNGTIHMELEECY